jgi:50S ribosomal subunit-associated GTPase HflX
LRPWRAHLAANPPLGTVELASLKQSIDVLASLGPLLAQIGRNPALGGPGLEDLRHSISRLRTAVAVLEQRTHELVRMALISWESRR